jgi:diguanylate cyclase (GGDEF)-like protein|uniref:GGDEF domain-containing protein n=1 Tax=Leptospirillum ferriphilum TaxID=178606 RepID=A0A7C3LS87_9BACT
MDAMGEKDKWPRWLQTQAIFLSGILFVVALLLVFGTLSMQNGLAFLRELHRQERLTDFRQKLEGVFRDLLESGGDERTWLLTGDERARASFGASTRKLVSDLDTLLHAPSPGAGISSMLPSLSRDIFLNLSVLQREIREPLVARSPANNPLPWESVEKRVRAIDEAVEADIGQLEIARQKRQNRLIIESVFFMILILVILFMGYAYLYRHNRGMDTLQEQLRELAFRDPLTGMANRRYLLQAMEWALGRMLRDPHVCVVFYLDLDRFKEVNDRLGHQAGDRLLVEFSRRLVSRSRKGDLVARLGGDEFVIFCDPVQNVTDVPEILRKILLRVTEEPLLPEEGFGEIGISTGWASYPEDAKIAEELLRIADQRMYEAKTKRGKKGPPGREDPFGSV